MKFLFEGSTDTTLALVLRIIMRTSSNGNIFCVTGPLWGEITGHWWISLKKASGTKLWCFLWSTPEQMVEQTIKTLLGWGKMAYFTGAYVRHATSMSEISQRNIKHTYSRKGFVYTCTYFFRTKNCFQALLLHDISVDLPMFSVFRTVCNMLTESCSSIFTSRITNVNMEKSAVLSLFARSIYHFHASSWNGNFYGISPSWSGAHFTKIDKLYCQHG